MRRWRRCNEPGACGVTAAVVALNYRTFEATDADYELLAEIDSGGGDQPVTVDDLRRQEGWWPPDPLRGREFILLAGRCIGASIHYRFGKEASNPHSFFFTLLPAYRGRDLEAGILEHLIEDARGRGATAVITNSRDSDAGRLQALDHLGFEPTTSYVDSRLDLEGFLVDPFGAKMRRLQSQGIETLSAPELERGGRDWLSVIYDLAVPDVAGEPRQTLEEFRARIRNPKTWFPPGQFAALKGKICVGFASLERVRGDPDTAMTSMTAVHPTYRRKGIATALKVACLEAAKKAGIRYVKTHNEAGNPMLQINFQLGFQKVRATLCYRKPL